MIYLHRYEMNQDRHVDAQRYRETEGREGISPRISVSVALEFEYEPAKDTDTVALFYEAVKALTEAAQKPSA